MEREQLLRETELFVLDMDGTFYLGDQILEGALEFLLQVERSGKRFVFSRTTLLGRPRSI